MIFPDKSTAVRKQKIKKNTIKARLVFFIWLTVMLLLIVIFAHKLCPYNPDLQDLSISLQPPSVSHPLGTDKFGRDMLSRVIMGLRTSISSTLTLVVIITVFGTAVGVICGYFGGIQDSIMMRISDMCLAFPGLVFALAIAAILNGGIENAVIALAVISWPKYARIARSNTLALKNMDYIYAARLAGSSPFKIIIRHILPNSLGTILVTSMLDIGTMMMEIAGLSFLGLGAKPPIAELGSMMSVERSMLQTYPWVILAPGVAIFISVVIFNLLGDTVRDYVDPRSSRER